MARPISLTVLGLVTVLAAHPVGIREARANCAVWLYTVTADSDTGRVTICADGVECAAGGVLLREDLETGEVYELQGNCTESTFESCFIDECVPAGAYRYGTPEPLQCGCGRRAIFEEIELGTTEGCEPPELVRREDGVPWGSESSERCGSGCVASSDSTTPGFPASLMVVLVALSILVRRRRC